jgi:ubiquinone/menaquinone biosynthesis C-methylase UbiE
MESDDTMKKGRTMPSEEQGETQQMSMWSSSETAERWQQDIERRRHDFAVATERMLDAAALKSGDHVLDVAAGTGDQSLMAARIVGPGGSILVTDVSAEMLDIAARVAEQEGLTTITTRVMDAEQLDLDDNTFDTVICRLGLMLMAHPQQALREIQRVLKPGGKLAALVWSVSEHNPLLARTLVIVAKYARAAPPDGPNPFALSDPAVFERDLKEAGFREVMTSAIPFTSHYASLDAFLESTASRLTASVMGQLSQQEQQHLLEEVRQALSPFEGSEGLVAPAEMLLGAGSK